MTSASFPLASLRNFLEDSPSHVLLETVKSTDKRPHSFLFSHPVKTVVAYPGESLSEKLDAIQAALDEGYYVAGYLAYELGYALEPSLQRLLPREYRQPLIHLGVFEAPYVYDHVAQCFDRPVDDIAVDPSFLGYEYSLKWDPKGLDEPNYKQRIQEIKTHIEQGDIYQLNYTERIKFEVRGSFVSLYDQLRRLQGVEFASLMKMGEQRVLSLSPELFFHLQDDRVVVKPMKGTMSRGGTPQQDQWMAQKLANDPKNQSENVMIVDLLRNDLGKICQSGSIDVPSLFAVDAYESLFQMTSTIQGQLHAKVGVQEIVQALFLVVP